MVEGKMAWNQLLKKGNFQSRPATGQGVSSHEEDRKLEIDFVNLKRLEESCKRLHKETKRYEDCVVELQELQRCMASDLVNSTVAKDHPPLRSLAEQYQSVVYQMKDYTDDLKQLSKKTIQEPLKKLNPEFAAISAALKRRDTALGECVRAKAKLEKLEKVEKTSANVAKLEQAKKAHQSAKDEYERQNKLLLLELPQFYEKRIDYFQPCLQALVRSQVNYYGEASSLFARMTDGESDDYFVSDADFQDELDKNLEALRSLSIVGK